MTNDNTHEYTLSTLFSGDRKIVIPDLQRDYCWGGPGTELVSDFVGNLIDQYGLSGDDDVLNLGVVYGYEQPKGRIQLCDGQQRITTLFLLLGMLNRQSEGNQFQQLLISDFELLRDDKEPYLQYAIRESSLYFLSDLVCNFFLTSDIASVEEISKSPWYFNEYRNDASIKSMIEALKIIEGLLAGKEKGWCGGFGQFLTTKLRFLYFDLGNRSNGEETFVVINTTGEPLSATQNLKPLVCAAPINADYARDNNIYEHWEEMETWFWLRRRNDNDTADAGFNEFLRWVAIIYADDTARKGMLTTGTYKLPYKEIKFEQIRSCWKALQFLFDEWVHRNQLDANWLSPATSQGKAVISQIDCFRIIPLIVYCQHWHITDPDDINLLRFHRFIDNLRHVQNVRSNVGEAVGEAIRIAEDCRDIIDLADSDLQISKTLLSEEERLKLNILRDNAAQRQPIEQAFWQAQAMDKVPSHNIWSGQIMPLLQWATTGGTFSLSDFQQYLGIFDTTFAGPCKENIDEVRRALLTRGLKQYPRIFRGNTVYSLGWEWNEWKLFINDNIGTFKAFFDDLLSGVTLQDMIDKYPQGEGLAAMVHEPRMMAFCKRKKLQEAYGTWYLMGGERFNGPHANIGAYAYYCYLENNVPTQAGWKRNFYPCDLSCVYYDYKREGLPNVAIDIIWNAGSNHDTLQIDLFDRGKDEESRRAQLQPVADALGYVWQDGRYHKHISMAGKNEKQVRSLADKECGLLFQAL